MCVCMGMFLPHTLLLAAAGPFYTMRMQLIEPRLQERRRRETERDRESKRDKRRAGWEQDKATEGRCACVDMCVCVCVCTSVQMCVRVCQAAQRSSLCSVRLKAMRSQKMMKREGQRSLSQLTLSGSVFSHRFAPFFAYRHTHTYILTHTHTRTAIVRSGTFPFSITERSSLSLLTSPFPPSLPLSLPPPLSLQLQPQFHCAAFTGDVCSSRALSSAGLWTPCPVELGDVSSLRLPRGQPGRARYAA